MKKALKRTISVLLVLIMLASSAVTAGAARNQFNVNLNNDSGGYGAPLLVDYSGNGTVINGTVVSDSHASVSADGDYVNIPVYAGKYVKGRGSSWSGWSAWGVNNNKKNPDFNVYNGTNKATEYKVKQRTEYKYEHTEKIKVDATKYYTQYRGNKWYNKYIFTTSSSWDDYPGAKANYSIVRQYKRTQSKYDYIPVTSDWRTYAPYCKIGDTPWKVCEDRTVYRYCYRTLYWDPKGSVTTEQVPLRYSLFNTQGEPIKCGIKWTSSLQLSKTKESYYGGYKGYIYTERYFLPLNDEDIATIRRIIECIKNGMLTKEVLLDFADDVALGLVSDALKALLVHLGCSSVEPTVIGEYIAGMKFCFDLVEALGYKCLAEELISLEKKLDANGNKTIFVITFDRLELTHRGETTNSVSASCDVINADYVSMQDIRSADTFGVIEYIDADCRNEAINRWIDIVKMD